MEWCEGVEWHGGVEWYGGVEWHGGVGEEASEGETEGGVAGEGGGVYNNNERGGGRGKKHLRVVGEGRGGEGGGKGGKRGWMTPAIDAGLLRKCIHIYSAMVHSRSGAFPFSEVPVVRGAQ